MAKLKDKIATTLKNTINFVNLGVWELQLKKMSRYNRIGINVVRVIILAYKGYQKDECPIRASALTYFTLLSIVPVIAVAFAISKGFGLEQMLEQEITSALSSQKEVMTYVLGFSKKMLSSTKGGVLAVISIGFLLYAVLRLFHHIESAVNTIWNVKKSRSFLRKFTDYMSILLIAPILMIGSSGVTVYINTIIKNLAQEGMFQMISPILILIMQIVPFIIMWLLFTTIYIIMPNTKVKFGRAFIAGIVAGTIFQLIQIYYIDLQFAFSKYNAVYGSFAALPLFLIWVQFSWLVFMFGAEISAALDKVRTYGNKHDYELLSTSRKRLLNFLVLKYITAQFKDGNDAPSMEKISDNLQLPVRYIEQITDNLMKAQLINEVIPHTDKPNGFQPAIDISSLSFAAVYKKMDSLGSDKLLINDNEEFDKMNAQFEEFSSLIDKNYSELLIKNM